MAKSELIDQITVRLPAHSYPILTGYNLLQNADLLRQYIASSQVMVVTNTTIAPYYLHFLQSALSERQCHTVILEDGEIYKNQASLFKIYDALINNNYHRDATLVALGGGVVGDISGFAASTYQRGINLVQIPTTLLAQVDSSVGGKTAINHPAGKNMIGSFYQPQAVIMDLNTLHTLPPREFAAGLAEVIKYAVLAGGDFKDLVSTSLANGLTPASRTLPEIIKICCQIKADYVVQDERETGVRALLNLGHTVGHALEAYTGYSRWLHGEAVAIGLYCAALLSRRYCNLAGNELAEIDNMLAQAQLPRRIPADIDLEKVFALMAKDKKIKNNVLRFILIKNLGSCYVEEKVERPELYNVLKNAVKGEQNK
ncbi:3-dehydroquinate synthase [Legionella dresdenensis]|uniref:3-dehydroquinate synthase n=1 Tax=Legionella dresdenensis TaxID=450200 RepID=A0ABV8CDQ7_9GAMM